MEQESQFVFGRTYGASFAASCQSNFYKNVSFQLVLSENDDITVVDENNEIHVGRIVLIKPLTLSKIQCDGQVTHLHLSPTIDFTLDLIDLGGEANIIVLTSAQLLPFNAGSSRSDIIAILDKLGELPIKRLDPRLIAVLEYLSQNLDNPSILNAAKCSGLSRSRIRTLAREQIGVPLSTWVMWKKLVEANKALSAGADLSEAALAGCFADLSHFSRTMKRMFGVTPTEALSNYIE